MNSDVTFKKLNFRFKILAVCLGLAISLVLIEVSLQFLSIYVNRSYQSDNTKNYKYRILAVGESTTEAFLNNGIDVSWPSQLELNLNKKNNNLVKIYNIGKSATRVGFLKKSLKQEVERFRPQAVMAMMGINDIEALDYLHSENPLENLKIIKVFKWIRASLKQSKIPTQNEQSLMYSAVLSINLELNNKEIVENIKKELNLVDDKLKWFFLREVTGRLYKKSVSFQLPGSDHKEFIRYNDLANWTAVKAYESSNLDETSLRYVLITTRNDNKEQMDSFLSILDKAFSNGMEIDNSIATMFITIFRAHPKYNEYSIRLGLKVKNKIRAIEQLREDYRDIALYLNSQNISLIVMSYPTTKIDIFKSFFVKNFTYDAEHLGLYINRELPYMEIEPQFSNVQFISNENFLEANDLLKPNYIFTDLFTSWFGGKFGHTTALGHAMITENILKNIKDTENIFGKEFKK